MKVQMFSQTVSLLSVLAHFQIVFSVHSLKISSEHNCFFPTFCFYLVLAPADDEQICLSSLYKSTFHNNNKKSHVALDIDFSVSRRVSQKTPMIAALPCQFIQRSFITLLDLQVVSRKWIPIWRQ